MLIQTIISIGLGVLIGFLPLRNSTLAKIIIRVIIG